MQIKILESILVMCGLLITIRRIKGASMNKFLVVIAIFILGISVFTFQSMSDNSISINNAESTNNTVSSEPDLESIADNDDSFNPNREVINTDKQLVNNSAPSNKLIAELPVQLDLLGLVYSKLLTESYAQIAFDGNIAEFKIDEEIHSTLVYLNKVNKKSIFVDYQSVNYEIKLSQMNSLEEQRILVEFNQMTAKEIGSRPRQIEHIVGLLPSPFNDGGKLITPGQNPDLYNSARFKEGDVLLEVNGFNIDDEASFDELQTHIRTAQTLKFVVFRGGRRITLYLDIPSETLKM
ncbi:MAG: type II secretion system protein C [Glaciecola sp.]|jgi:type II secretion system protein C